MLLDRLLAQVQPEALEHSAEIQIGYCRFRCLSDSAAQISAINAFFPVSSNGPAADIAEANTISHTIISKLYADLPRLIQECATHTPTFRREIFVGETEIVKWVIGDYSLYAECSGGGYRTDYVLLQAPGNLTAVFRLHNGPSLYTYLLRALREIYLREMENAGGISMHAAGARCGDDGLMFVGRKGSGKTTLALAACLAPRGAYIANDRTILSWENGEPTIHAFPLACRVGIGTASALAQCGKVIDPALLTRPQDYRLAKSDRSMQQLTPTLASTLKYELTPVEMVTRLGLTHSNRAKLRCIIIPCFSLTDQRLSLHPWEGNAVYDALSEQAQTPNEEKWKHSWLIEHVLSHEILRQRVDADLRRLIDTVPIASLNFGTTVLEPKIFSECISPQIDQFVHSYWLSRSSLGDTTQ